MDSLGVGAIDVGCIIAPDVASITRKHQNQLALSHLSPRIAFSFVRVVGCIIFGFLIPICMTALYRTCNEALSLLLSMNDDFGAI